MHLSLRSISQQHNMGSPLMETFCFSSGLVSVGLLGLGFSRLSPSLSILIDTGLANPKALLHEASPELVIDYMVRCAVHGVLHHMLRNSPVP